MKKNKVDLKKVEELYSGNVEKFGIDSRSVGWNSADSQNLRFSKLLSMISEPARLFTLNELGCGYGELVKYFQKNNFNCSHYHGFDISAKMIEKAKEYIDEKNIDLILSSSITTQADYSVTSGIFNVIFDSAKTNWEDYIKDTLRNMNESSAKGFSFNLLSKYVDYENENLYYADPAIFFDFCKKEFSKYVTLLHDYPLYEWTITVKKEV